MKLANAKFWTSRHALVLALTISAFAAVDRAKAGDDVNNSGTIAGDDGGTNTGDTGGDGDVNNSGTGGDVNNSGTIGGG